MHRSRIIDLSSLTAGFVFILAGCSESPPPLFGYETGGATTQPKSTAVVCAADSAVGVPINNRPSYAERLALYAADRDRAEPGKTGWPTFPAVPPLLWDDQLAQAAEAHSMDMRDTPCFQHNSCDGTDVFARIKSYFTGSFSTLGENIAAGVNDAQQVIESSWINEMGARPGETGHRENMFNGMYNYVGFGYLEGGQRFQGYWTQDLAGASPPAMMPRIPAGSHFPQHGPMVTFGAVYYDAAGTAPDKVEVVVDGKPNALPLVRGKDAAGAYEAALMIGAGCHRYYFIATRGGKPAGCYPGKGTLGAGDTGCADYDPTGQ